MFKDIVFKWLDVALDYGIDEFTFWNMTIAELERAVESKKRVKQLEARERASFDYNLADLIGRSVGRIYSSSAKLPAIEEAYPSLFDSQELEEARAARKAELSALRFKEFVKSHNDKFIKKEVAKIDNE